MSFDLTGALNLDPANSQINEGGFAAVENCTWACLADTIFDYTGVRHSAAELRLLDNQLQNMAGYAGGESWQNNLAVLADLANDLYKVAAAEYPGDVVAALRGYGEQGFVVHWAGWCTPQAQWMTANLYQGISHAGRLIKADDTTLTFWNVWTGYAVTQPDEFWSQSYDGGGILVFKQPLGGNALSLDSYSTGTNVPGDSGEGPFFSRFNAMYNYIADVEGKLAAVKDSVDYLRAQNDQNTQPRLAAVMGELDAIKASPAGSDPSVAAAVARIEAALRQA